MALSIQQPSLLAPHNALTLLCPHILDELTLATLTLPCHTNEVSAAENWVAEGVMNGPLSLPCLLFPADSRVALMFRKSWRVSLWGQGVFGNRGEPPKLVPSKGNLPPHPNRIHSVQGGPCGSLTGVIVSLCPRFAQQQNTFLCGGRKESDYVSNSPSDCVMFGWYCINSCFH